MNLRNYQYKAFHQSNFWSYFVFQSHKLKSMYPKSPRLSRIPQLWGHMILFGLTINKKQTCLDSFLPLSHYHCMASQHRMVHRRRLQNVFEFLHRMLRNMMTKIPTPIDHQLKWHSSQIHPKVFMHVFTFIACINILIYVHILCCWGARCWSLQAWGISLMTL